MGYTTKAKAALEKAIELDMAFVKDASNDFEERWLTYTEICQYLPKDYCYFGLGYGDDGKELTYYDDLHADRYETLDYPEIIEKLTSEDYDTPKITGDKVIAMKERMMQSGYGSCKNDW